MFFQKRLDSCQEELEVIPSCELCLEKEMIQSPRDVTLSSLLFRQEFRTNSEQSGHWEEKRLLVGVAWWKQPVWSESVGLGALGEMQTSRAPPCKVRGLSQCTYWTSPTEPG